MDGSVGIGCAARVSAAYSEVKELTGAVLALCRAPGMTRELADGLEMAEVKARLSRARKLLGEADYMASPHAPEERDPDQVREDVEAMRCGS